ncbi:MAG: sigma factor-like helix-turn-helix DNA-binding protein, partial [Sulfurihydrogenibium azorense]
QLSGGAYHIIIDKSFKWHINIPYEIFELSSLDENEKKVINYLFFEEKDPKEIQEIMGISLGRISQIKAKAVEKIREIMYHNNEKVGGKHEPYKRKQYK